MKDLCLLSRFPVFHSSGRPLAGMSAVPIVALLCAAPAARAITVTDVIPNAASNETRQNSEPSIAVNPLNSNQMVSGTFGGGPFWQSTNGGTTWISFGNLPNNDKSLAWRQDSVAPLAVT